jgi:hypothetical protein
MNGELVKIYVHLCLKNIYREIEIIIITPRLKSWQKIIAVDFHFHKFQINMWISLYGILFYKSTWHLKMGISHFILWYIKFNHNKIKTQCTFPNNSSSSFWMQVVTSLSIYILSHVNFGKISKAQRVTESYKKLRIMTSWNDNTKFFNLLKWIHNRLAQHLN